MHGTYLFTCISERGLLPEIGNVHTSIGTPYVPQMPKKGDCRNKLLNKWWEIVDPFIEMIILPPPLLPFPPLSFFLPFFLSHQRTYFY